MTALRCLLVVALTVPFAADAASFHWPFERQRHVVRHHHQRQQENLPKAPVILDCIEINAAVRALDTQHLERAVRKLNSRQRKIIEECRSRE